MQKARIKLFLQNKMRPLFVCEIVDKVEESVQELETKINDKTKETVRFGPYCFKRTDFKYFEIEYK